VNKLLLLAAVVGAYTCVAVPGVAAAGGIYTCAGAVGDPFNFSTSTIDANLDVPVGATCFLWGVTVTGNVTVEGALRGFGDTFDKNVIVNGGSLRLGCGFSVLCLGHAGSVVLGNGVVNGGVFAPSQTHFDNNLTIHGADSVDLELMGVDGRVMVSNSADVLVFDVVYGGDVSLINNSGDVLVGSATIGGKLNCEANTAPPTVQAFVIAESFHGQCAQR